MKLATLVSLVPSGGALSSARNALDGNAGSAFGSLLSSMAEDTPAVPTTASGSGASAASALRSDDEMEGQSQQANAASAADREAELSETAVVAAPSVAGGSRPAGGTGVTSLLTLAARAAVPARIGTISSSAVVDPDTASGAQALRRSVGTDVGEQASGRSARRASETDDDGDQTALTTTAQVPTVVTGLVIGSGALAATPVQSGSGATGTSSTVAAGATLQASSPAASTPDADPASPLDVSSASVAAGEIGGAAVPPGAAISIAIVPDSVRVESHLGFLRGVSGSDAASRSGVEADNGDTPADPTDIAPVLNKADSGDIASSSVVQPSSSLAADKPSLLVPDATVSAAMTVLASNAQAAAPVLQQVADGIVGLASTVVPDESGLGTQVAPARTMALQLSPAGLGTLTLRLHVAGRALDVQLEASDGRTAALIDRDRDALSDALSGRDYQLQSLSVTTHDATMPGAIHAERGPDTGSADPGSSGQPRDNTSSGGRGGNQGSREAPLPSRADDAAVERGGSSLFV